MSLYCRKTHGSNYRPGVVLGIALALLGIITPIERDLLPSSAADKSVSLPKKEKVHQNKKNQKTLPEVYDISSNFNSGDPVAELAAVEDLEHYLQSSQKDAQALQKLQPAFSGALQRIIVGHPVVALRRKALVLYLQFHPDNLKNRSGYQWFMYSLTRSDDQWLRHAAFNELFRYPSKSIGISAMETIRAKPSDTPLSELKYDYYLTFYSDHGPDTAREYYKKISASKADKTALHEFHLNLYRGQFWLRSLRQLQRLKKKAKDSVKESNLNSKSNMADSKGPNLKEEIKVNLNVVWRKVYGRAYSVVMKRQKLDELDAQLEVIRGEIVSDKNDCTACAWEDAKPGMEGLNAFKTGYTIWRGARFYHEQVNE